MLDALSPLGKDSIFGGDGAIYLWAKLPAGAAVMSPSKAVPLELCSCSGSNNWRSTAGVHLCRCLVQAARMMKLWFRGWFGSTRRAPANSVRAPPCPGPCVCTELSAAFRNLHDLAPPEHGDEVINTMRFVQGNTRFCDTNCALQVCILPGGSCGSPGYVRVAFANLRPDDCAEASGRLKGGLQQLVQHGTAVLSADPTGNEADGSAVQL